MNTHELIPPFSNEWWIYNLITIGLIVSIILIGRNLSINSRKKLTIYIGYIFMLEFLCMDVYRLYIGTWTIEESLPLHLCSLMWFVTIYLFLTKKQWAFEMMLYIGMPGGLHSLLTPELNHGGGFLNTFDFFLGHGGLVLAPFYALFVLNMRPRSNGWYISFIRLQAIVIVVFILNYLIESNYMYLSHPPLANNPLIPSDDLTIGQWPYYILIFEVAVLAHAFIINLPFLKIWHNTD